MALENSNQYLYKGRGPFDAKSIVKTYEDLLSKKTWTSEAGKIVAYNGMIVAVWLNKDDPTKNGIYYLQDPAVWANPTAAYVVPEPDVTNAANWHKLSGGSEVETETADFVTTEELAAELAAYAKAADVADVVKTSDFDAFKTTNDEAIQALQANLANIYDKTNIDAVVAALEAQIAAKADASTVADLTSTVTGNSTDIANLDTRVTATEGSIQTLDATVAQLTENVDTNTAKLNEISETVAELKEAIQDGISGNITLEPATSEKLGGIKSGAGDNIVSVDEDGIASVTTVNAGSLVQTNGDILILNGGSAANQAPNEV